MCVGHMGARIHLLSVAYKVNALVIPEAFK